MIKINMFFVLSFWLVSACQGPHAEAPSPIDPVPHQRQLDWQELEFYGFAHFNMNTFTNMEWGMGNEDPALFNPTDFDPQQWVDVCKAAGMKGLIITAKHHDGFCLWPTTTTDHSVKNAAWKNGEGDIIKEISEAFHNAGLKFGVYLSPWDRNHPDYGKQEYIGVFRQQLTELLTNYGEIFEVWFDGANGGTGYYGGANEERRVDKRNYYDWDSTFNIVRELQPDAVIFGDAGPDVRWVGNEHGFAYETTWSNLMRDSIYGGMPEYSEKYASGQENGTHWVPAESDVSIRPGWYYHEYEDHKVKSLPELLDIYYKSIGRNSSLLLNFPIDKRGKIHEKDVGQLMKLTSKIKEDFANNLVDKNAEADASDFRGKGFEPFNLTDGDLSTYWAPSDGLEETWISLAFDKAITFNRLMVQEHIPLGQRVKAFEISIMGENGWKILEVGTTIGYKRILRLPDTTTDAIKITITDTKAIPALSNLALYHAPKLVLEPEIRRDKAGWVTLSTPDDGVEVYYSLDGRDPEKEGEKYNGPFEVLLPKTLSAITIDPETGKKSELARRDLGVAKKEWKVLNGEKNEDHLIDENPSTNYFSSENQVTLDLGNEYQITGFSYLPTQNRYMSGVISAYEFLVSRDGRSWSSVSKGEFGNIANSPTEQMVEFNGISGRFIQLKALETLDGNPAGFAEIGLIIE
ncbi:MAG: alpha-L-fucosidase [Cyclobacteriaceae bacterium]